MKAYDTYRLKPQKLFLFIWIPIFKQMEVGEYEPINFGKEKFEELLDLKVLDNSNHLSEFYPKGSLDVDKSARKFLQKLVEDKKERRKLRKKRIAA